MHLQVGNLPSTIVFGSLISMKLMLLFESGAPSIHSRNQHMIFSDEKNICTSSQSKLLILILISKNKRYFYNFTRNWNDFLTLEPTKKYFTIITSYSLIRWSLHGKTITNSCLLFFFHGGFWPSHWRHCVV